MNRAAGGAKIFKVWIVLAGLLGWIADGHSLYGQSGPFSSRGESLSSGLFLLAQGDPGSSAAGSNFAPTEGEPGDGSYKVPGTPWYVYVFGVLGFGFLGTVFYLGIKYGTKGIRIGGEEGKIKQKSGGVKVTDDQVDNYRLLNLMATGQTSQVYEVAEVASGRHFALKMLLPEHARNPQQRQFLFHEAEVGQKIIHPNIIKMLVIKKDPFHPYVVMEYFPSTNLKLRLMHKDPSIKENFKKIVDQAATALAFMHDKGWVHRDVKPDNILVNSSAEVRLIDFAISRRLSRKKSLFGKRGGKAQGTRSYMSPEQIRCENLDERADIYSFGVALYELLTFRPPFRAGNPQELLQKQLGEKPEPPQIYNPDIADDLSKLIMQMLSKRKEERPKDFQEFLLKFRGMRFLFKSAVVKKRS
jgi:eukaryotic-like serine/threonine-protein kinase